MRLPDIQPLCGVNVAGLTGVVRLFPLSTVLSVPPSDGGAHTGALVVADAEYYLDVYPAPSAGQYAESEEDADQGSFVKARLVLSVSRDDEDLAAALLTLRRLRYFLAVYRDGNGRTKLVGSLSTPLRFLSSFDTGRKGGDVNGHQLVFTAELTEPASFYYLPVDARTVARRAFAPGFSFGFL